MLVNCLILDASHYKMTKTRGTSKLKKFERATFTVKSKLKLNTTIENELMQLRSLRMFLKIYAREHASSSREALNIFIPIYSISFTWS
jgi:hypothetical protein